MWQHTVTFTYLLLKIANLHEQCCKALKICGNGAQLCSLKVTNARITKTNFLQNIDIYLCYPP